MNIVPEELLLTILLILSSLDGRHIKLAFSATTFKKNKFLYMYFIKLQSSNLVQGYFFFSFLTFAIVNMHVYLTVAFQ